MGIALLVIGLVVLVGGIAFGVLAIRNYLRDAKHLTMPKNTEYKFLIFFLAIGLSGILLQLSIHNLGAWKMSAGEVVLCLIGVFLFFFASATLWTAFILKYWKKSPDKKEKKYTNIVLFSSIGIALIGFLLLGEGAANHLLYPLVKGIQFGGYVSNGYRIGNSNIYFLTCDSVSSGGFSLAWYGIIIVFGALVCYWISDHEFYKKFGKHGIIDTLLLVAFPSGIICARIGYVIGNWNGDATTIWNPDGTWAGGFKPFSVSWASGEWYRVFYLWEGGLTILGGAIGGIIAGVLFMRLRRKYVDIRWAIDVIVPTILLAQAIGRWGNFFNHEVYGGDTDMSQWMFLPTWIRYQMAQSFSGGMPSSTAMYVPLFLIEGVANLAGYFIIKYAIGKSLKKHLALGDLAACYLIWYGIVRLIMEPLRNSTFNMGSNGNWSIIWSILYIVFGVLLIVAFHFWKHFEKKKAAAAVTEEPKSEVVEAKKEEIPAPKDAPIEGEDKPLGEEKKK